MQGHHITERCQEFFETIEFDHFVALSATVPKAAKQRIRDIVPNIVEYRISARKAIEDNILPDPKVVLIKLFLNTKNNTECIVLNKGKGKPITVDWDNRKGYIEAKYPEIRINCTEWQYYNYVTAKINTLKRQYFRSKRGFLKDLWLQKAGERLKWLARHKNRYITWLMANTFKDMRALIFCSDVEQTEQLCPNAINSKDSGTSMDILAKFNEGKINQIAACQMLNEGVNLVNCKLGMFAALNSSEILQKQKKGIDWLKENKGGECDYVVLITQLASGDVVQERVRAAVKAFDDKGIKYGEVVEIEGQSDVAVIQQRFNDFLTAHPDAHNIVVFGINLYAGQGVVAAAETADRADDVKVFTCNVDTGFTDEVIPKEGKSPWIFCTSNFTELYGEQCCELEHNPCAMQAVSYETIGDYYDVNNWPWERATK